MVGHRLVEALLERDLDATWQVTVLAEEARPAYDRIALSSLFAGKTEADLTLADLAAPGRVRVCLGERAVHIDRARRVVTTTAGAAYGYDELVLATGSLPFVPPIPGADHAGC